MDKTFQFSGYEADLINREIKFFYKIIGPEETLSFLEKILLPELEIDQIPEVLRDNILTSLHLVLGISYWKLYCPDKIDIGGISLTKDQADFWNKVYIKGLGEFFFRNKIDFRNFNLFKANSEKSNSTSFSRKDRALVPIGGGKDSIVSAELLKRGNVDFDTFTLGESLIQNEINRILDKKNIVIKRIIDPQLFELNKREDTYNGHIPISSIYNFTALLAAVLYDFSYVVFSNEKSANYGNVEYLGVQINHQWSKSFEFEELFSNYVKSYITDSIVPFSLLRSYNEIEIVKQFIQYPAYFPVFSSCNRNFKINDAQTDVLWCGKCAKCLFIFVTLVAFLPKEEVVGIFNKNLFENRDLIPQYEELLGIKEHKPFDCVGTPDEVRLAFLLAYQKHAYDNTPIMEMFIDKFKDQFIDIEKTKEDLLSGSGKNNIPNKFENIIKI
ncbi:MAG TPA: hypothetical protein VG917_00935 [Patescibacteria group bacterium]|nr:hypothetical protein [Patescibacteria group bacterium]